MNKLINKKLPISCLCSIYKETLLNEFILSIDSLLVQEYIPNEIIIIVDGPINYELKNFLEYLKNKKKFFKIYFIKENKGLGNALNYGISKCRNKFIARFDSDDINLENRLKIQYDFILNNPGFSVIGSDVIEFNNDSKLFNIKKMENNNIYKKLYFYMFRNPINHPSVLMRKKDIIKVGSYKNIKYFEDYELWLRCIKNGLKIHNINQNLVAMRRSNLFSKRRGYQYTLCELKFLKFSLQEKQIKSIFIPLYIIRIFIRIMPNKIANLTLIFDLKRKNKINSKFLKNYQSKILSNPSSLLNQYSFRSK